MPTPTASARCCRATCAVAPATSRSSKPCWTPAPRTGNPIKERKREAVCSIRRWRRPRAGGDPYAVPARTGVMGSRLRGNDRMDRAPMKPTNLFVGSAVERLEDLRFLRGRGEYVDDLTREGLLHAAILRSSVAHGRIRAIDSTAALALPGVQAVITAADMSDGVPIIPMRLQPLPEFKPYEQPVIADRKVRYVGEPVAVVLAASAALAEDALSLI